MLEKVRHRDADGHGYRGYSQADLERLRYACAFNATVSPLKHRREPAILDRGELRRCEPVARVALCTSPSKSCHRLRAHGCVMDYAGSRCRRPRR